MAGLIPAFRVPRYEPQLSRAEQRVYARYAALKLRKQQLSKIIKDTEKLLQKQRSEQRRVNRKFGQRKDVVKRIKKRENKRLRKALEADMCPSTDLDSASDTSHMSDDTLIMGSAGSAGSARSTCICCCICGNQPNAEKSAAYRDEEVD